MKRLSALALLGLVIFVGCNNEGTTDANKPADGGAAPAAGTDAGTDKPAE
jgi:hypothetical protein